MLRNKLKRAIAVVIPIIIIGTSNGVNAYSELSDSTVGTSTATSSITIQTATSAATTSSSVLTYTDDQGVKYEIDDTNKIAKVSSQQMNRNFKTVIIPKSINYNEQEYAVTTIGSLAFYGCNNLTSVTISNSVTKIDDNAFEGCSELTSITIPDSVLSINCGAFEYCSNLSSIIIPNSVTSIGIFAFNGCSSLKNIIIPDNVTNIDIATLNVTSIGNSIKDRCNYVNTKMGGKLQDSVITSDVYQSDDGVLFYRNAATLTATATAQVATGTTTVTQTAKSGDISVVPVIAMMVLGAVGMKKNLKCRM